MLRRHLDWVFVSNVILVGICHVHRTAQRSHPYPESTQQPLRAACSSNNPPASQSHRTKLMSDGPGQGRKICLDAEPHLRIDASVIIKSHPLVSFDCVGDFLIFNPLYWGTVQEWAGLANKQVNPWNSCFWCGSWYASGIARMSESPVVVMTDCLEWLDKAGIPHFFFKLSLQNIFHSTKKKQTFFPVKSIGKPTVQGANAFSCLIV